MEGPQGPRGAPEDDGQRVLILGIGNTLRGDDALGYYYALALKACGVERCAVEAIESPRPHDAALLEGADVVVVVDAILAEGEPGSVIVLDGSQCSLTGSPEELVHETSACDLIALASCLGIFKGRSFVVGVIPLSLESGPPSAAAVRGLLKAHRVIEELLRESPCRLPPAECVALQLSRLFRGLYGEATH